nr:hypothetical protein [Cupriavidus gilardii]
MAEACAVPARPPAGQPLAHRLPFARAVAKGRMSIDAGAPPVAEACAVPARPPAAGPPAGEPLAHRLPFARA